MVDLIAIAEKKLNFLGKELVDEIIDTCPIKEIPAKTELIKEGQYVKVVPIILKGIVKVYTQREDKELLLYYIQPEESCVMSFTACLKGDKSKVFASTIEDTVSVLIPSDKLFQWLVKYPSLTKLYYQQFDLRYSELVDTIQQLLYDKLDKRLIDYLSRKVSVTGKNPVKLSHKEIANELGTAREVVSRVVKKLERENKLKQHYDSIELFTA